MRKVVCTFLCICLTAALVCGAPKRDGLLRMLLPITVRERQETVLCEDAWTTKQIIQSNREYLKEQVIGENRELFDAAARGVETPAKTEEAAEVFLETTPHPEIDLSPELLADPSYLMEHFFIRDPNASLAGVDLDAAKFLDADLTLSKKADGPQILIYHSHSQEGFADSDPADPSTTIVGVGTYLCRLLEERYGYRVLHLTDTFDIIGGTLDRSRAYDFSGEKVRQILEQQPSIEVVIDLHRDGVAENRRLVTEIGGKQTAQLMCFNGVSNTVNNGPVDYLPNPYISQNLAFSFQLALQAARYYPGLYRGIYLAGLRYNLHLRPKALLLEAGAQTNTAAEVKNAMEPFAELLHRVLRGTP